MEEGNISDIGKLKGSFERDIFEKHESQKRAEVSSLVSSL